MRAVAGDAADPRDILEREFSQQVRDLAKIYRWKTYFTWTSIHSPQGFPDLVLCRPPRLVFAELKRENGRTTEHQDRWLGLLSAVPGVEVFLWRPSDLERIAGVLR